jgi:hypothetical protein
VLGGAGDAESFAMAATHLDNAALKDEACLATVTIAERLVKEKPDAVVPTMGKVLKISQDAKLVARANEVLKHTKAPPAP